MEETLFFITEIIPRGGGRYDAIFYLEKDGKLLDLSDDNQVADLLHELYNIEWETAHRAWITAQEEVGLFDTDNYELRTPIDVTEVTVCLATTTYRKALLKAAELAKKVRREEGPIRLP